MASHDIFDNSEEKSLYKLGWVLYMTFWFTQVVILIGTYFFAWFVYVRIALFFKPDEAQTSDDSTSVLEQNLLKQELT